ncbi:anaphase-promoting complex subunit 5 [Trichonephila clavipes]|nr:anaphase-promoting complex subunit 5 [Trichonephila clavipes]
MVLPDQPSSSSASKSVRDYVTPHKISLLVLVKEFCNVRQHSLTSTEEITWEHNVKNNRDFVCTLLKLIQNPDMDLKRLINIIHPVLHPKTYQSFIERRGMNKHPIRRSLRKKQLRKSKFGMILLKVNMGIRKANCDSIPFVLQSRREIS